MIVRLDGYNMIIEHRTRDQSADSLSKKTEFYERQEQREADRPEIKVDFILWTRRHVIVYHLRANSTSQVDRSKINLIYPQETTILKRQTGKSMEILLKSKLVRETLK